MHYYVFDSVGLFVAFIILVWVSMQIRRLAALYHFSQCFLAPGGMYINWTLSRDKAVESKEKEEILTFIFLIDIEIYCIAYFRMNFNVSIVFELNFYDHVAVRR
jgi:hypothetical protein